MTKRVVIANLSNWDGEDFEISIRRDNYGRVETETCTLQPGEHCDICWGGKADVEIIDRQRDIPPIRPFRVIAESQDGSPNESLGQTFPKMSIDWESKRGQVIKTKF